MNNTEKELRDFRVYIVSKTLRDIKSAIGENCFNAIIPSLKALELVDKE
jgi:hypothetical protein